MSELNNARHEAFAQGIAEGKTQKEAYMQAFPNCHSWKDRTIINRACDLARRDDVSERVQELQQQTTSDVIMSITARKEWLTRLVMDGQEATPNRLKALDILNKMDGAYVEQVNVNGTINNPFSGLTTEELRKLARDG